MLSRNAVKYYCQVLLSSKHSQAILSSNTVNTYLGLMALTTGPLVVAAVLNNGPNRN